jgi:hypothetical protein
LENSFTIIFKMAFNPPSQIAGVGGGGLLIFFNIGTNQSDKG